MLQEYFHTCLHSLFDRHLVNSLLTLLNYLLQPDQKRTSALIGCWSCSQKRQESQQADTRMMDQALREALDQTLFSIDIPLWIGTNAVKPVSQNDFLVPRTSHSCQRIYVRRNAHHEFQRDMDWPSLYDIVRGFDPNFLMEFPHAVWIRYLPPNGGVTV